MRVLCFSSPFISSFREKSIFFFICNLLHTIFRTEFSSVCLLSEHNCPSPHPRQVENPWMLTLFHSLIYLKYLLRLIMWQALDKHWGFSVETHSLGQRGKHTQITVIQCSKCYNIGTVSSDCSGNPGGSL